MLARHLFARALFVALLLGSAGVRGQYGNTMNVCSNIKTIIPSSTTTVTKVIYTFTCTASAVSNPELPSLTSCNPLDFNEMNLSPNFYNQLPLSTLCTYTNVYSINFSSNRFTSLTGAFVFLACLPNLRSLDFSYNLITSPVMSNDFADSLASTLVYLNLNNNQIPYIQSKTFINNDGTSRFPNLLYIGLANNQLKSVDLLWPLALPNLVLQVDMRNNPITTLVNELERPYNDTIFATPMSGYRNVDISNNKISSISDFNLLQYGLYNVNDFQAFITKIQNYDLRLTSRKPSLCCTCPASGLYTNTWYSAFCGKINNNYIFLDLYCVNIKSQIFNFDCPIPKPPAAAASTANLNYLWLLLLLIPLLLCCCCCFLFCCGRCCQLCTFDCFLCVLCPCLRPDKKKSFCYDATILYNACDQRWVEKEFLAQLCEFGSRCTYNKIVWGQHPPSEVERDLSMSRRVIIILTDYFLDTDWKCNKLKGLIKRTCLNDPDCVLMIINRTDLSDRDLRKIFNDFQLKESPQSMTTVCSDSHQQTMIIETEKAEPISFGAKLQHKLKTMICYSLALNDVELLHYKNPSFWSHFFYVMPHNCNKQKEASFTDLSRTQTAKPLPLTDLCKDAIFHQSDQNDSSIVHYVQSSSVYEKTVTEFEPVSSQPVDIPVRCRAPEYVLVEHRYVDGENCYEDDGYDNSRGKGRGNLNVSFARESDIMGNQPYYTTRHDCYNAGEQSPYIAATTLNQHIVDSGPSSNVTFNSGRLVVNSRFQDSQDLNNAQMNVSLNL